jgi:hypothetical protein
LELIIQQNPKKHAGNTPKQWKKNSVWVSFWVLKCHFCRVMSCCCHPAARFTVMGVARSVENQLKIIPSTTYPQIWSQICRAG